jgi:MFS family permease
MPLPRASRNVLLLAICQALWMTSTSAVVTVTALAGLIVAPDPSLSTLALGLQFITTTCATIPASLLMARIGRRDGFSLGVLIGAAGGALSAYALMQGSFPLFCLGAMLIGGYNAFAVMYRLAAADAASHGARSRAISLVMAGGVVAAYFGPELAKVTRLMLEPVLFAGTYLAMIALSAVTLVILRFIDIPVPVRQAGDSDGRPLGVILRQPKFVAAAVAGMLSYGTMALVMTATPLAMLACSHSFDETAFVIQWHVLGMFAPAFVTGHLIARFGLINVMQVGVLMMVGCVLINLTGIEVAQFWSALILLGVGWNFLFVGATTLLTESYHPGEKAKVQATNDFLVFGVVAVASLSAGTLQEVLGWQAVNLSVLPMLAVTLGALIWLRFTRALESASPVAG